MGKAESNLVKNRKYIAALGLFPATVQKDTIKKILSYAEEIYYKDVIRGQDGTFQQKEFKSMCHFKRKWERKIIEDLEEGLRKAEARINEARIYKARKAEALPQCNKFIAAHLKRVAQMEKARQAAADLPNGPP